MSNGYRHVVIGGGVIGTAAALRLAERSGGDVLLLEQYRFGPARRSSTSDHASYAARVSAVYDGEW